MRDLVTDCNVQLKQALSLVTDVIPIGSHIAMVDEPVHRNIGDHLIHLGTERFFHEHDMQVVARANTYSYHRRWFRRQLRDDTIIVCHGGGHLGDLYLAHQRLREQLVKDFPSHRVVVLPQSIFFQDAGEMQRAAAAFRGHADFHLFVRDLESLQRARQMRLPNLYLAPDMVHALHPFELTPGVNKTTKKIGDTLCLLRRDREWTAPATSPKSCDCSRDWSDLVSIQDTLLLGSLAAAYRLSRAFGPPSWLHQILDRERTSLVHRATALFAGFERIATSRLHGMLFGILCGKKIHLLPSLTGKTAAYYQCWFAENTCSKLVDIQE